MSQLVYHKIESLQIQIKVKIELKLKKRERRAGDFLIDSLQTYTHRVLCIHIISLSISAHKDKILQVCVCKKSVFTL
mgnify:CR=1 FL=1